MNIITESNKEEIVIKNSRFISFAYYVETEEEIKSILDKLSKEYKDYTHLVYAYRLVNKEKAVDDGEPGGTAGLPIMEVIKKNDLINILIVSIRYFGGIKLGAGGLIRAYSKSAREVLNNIKLEKYIKYNYYRLISSYDNLKLLNTLSSDFDIIRKDFNEEIIYDIKIEDDKDNILDIFKDCSIEVKKLWKNHNFYYFNWFLFPFIL